jgi:hypothetical protein
MNGQLTNINKILDVLKENDLIANTIHGEDLLKGVKILNEMLYKTYVIFYKYKDPKIRKKLLANIKYQGKPFLTEKQVDLIVNKYGDYVLDLYNHIANVYQHRNEVLKDFSIDKTKKSGNDRTLGGKRRTIGDGLNILFAKIPQAVESMIVVPRVMIQPVLDQAKMVMGDLTNPYRLIDWFFFPLYNLENLPIIGGFIGAQLDIIGGLLESSALIVSFIAPFILPVISALLSLASAVPGVGAALAPVNIAMDLGGDFIIEGLTHIVDVQAMFFHLSRKEYNMAYLKLLEILPTLEEIMTYVVYLMRTANKYIEKVVVVSSMTREHFDEIYPVVEPVVKNPELLKDREFLYEKLYVPNKDRIPLFQYISKHEADFAKLGDLFETLMEIHLFVRDAYSEGIDLGFDVQVGGIMDKLGLGALGKMINKVGNISKAIENFKKDVYETTK